MHLLNANLQTTRLQCLRNFRLFLSERQAREGLGNFKQNNSLSDMGGGGR